VECGIVLASQDWGVSPAEHGQLNAILFGLCSFIVVLVGAPFCMLTSWRQRAVALMMYLVLFGGYFAVTVPMALDEWPKGINGRMLMFKEGFCTVRKVVPWIALSPVRQNLLFSSTNACAPPPPFQAALHGGSLLVSGYEGVCSAHLFGGPLQSIQTTMPVHPGVPLHTNATFVQVQCGSMRRSLVQPPDPATLQYDHSHLPLLVIGIDTVSRAAAWRKLPLTMEVLGKVDRRPDVNLYQFMRYHTVGFATVENTKALFVGSIPRYESFSNRCPHFAAASKGSFLWSYQMCGQDRVEDLYTPTLSEDWFQYVRTKRPTKDMFENRRPWCSAQLWPKLTTGAYSGGPYSITPRCLDGRVADTYGFDYYLDPEHQSPPPPVAVLWSLAGHEATEAVLSSIDQALASFISELELTRIAVLLVSDHGNHIGMYPYTTAGGWVEMSNPLSVLILPAQNVTGAQDEALRRNEQRLTTHYDMYETLVDLIQGVQGDNQTCSEYGRSLFQDVGARTVVEAGIKSGCMCEECELFTHP